MPTGNRAATFVLAGVQHGLVTSTGWVIRAFRVAAESGRMHTLFARFSDLTSGRHLAKTRTAPRIVRARLRALERQASASDSSAEEVGGKW